MGLKYLALVAPVCEFPCQEAEARASGAEDLLAQAVIHANLDDALSDQHLIIGASARHRSIPHRELRPNQLLDLLKQKPPETRIAIVFGREHSGLTNFELDRCHYWLRIPTNPGFSSLNLAAAVQIVAYECFLAEAALADSPPLVSTDVAEYASDAELESFYAHLERVLYEIEFLHSRKSAPSLMRRIRRMFNRSLLEKREVNILRGILTAMQSSMGRQNGNS